MKYEGEEIANVTMYPKSVSQSRHVISCSRGSYLYYVSRFDRNFGRTRRSPEDLALKYGLCKRPKLPMPPMPLVCRSNTHHHGGSAFQARRPIGASGWNGVLFFPKLSANSPNKFDSARICHEIAVNACYTVTDGTNMTFSLFFISINASLTFCDDGSLTLVLVKGKPEESQLEARVKGYLQERDADRSGAE